jgi:methyltransferase family protein
VFQVLRKTLQWLWERRPIDISFRRPRPVWDGDLDRFSYQQKYNTFDIPDAAKVLDIGGGHYPFPKATILSDCFLEVTRHRHEPLVRDHRPFLIFDIHNLPFADKSIDFIYCSHVLEHVENPYRACSELMRVGHQGYIETPTMASDTLFSWAKGMHKWHVAAVGKSLVFFEYTPRQLEGIRCSTWRDIILGKTYHPLQAVFYENMDLFNIMFGWSENFTVFVFHLDGSVKTLNVDSN